MAKIFFRSMLCVGVSVALWGCGGGGSSGGFTGEGDSGVSNQAGPAATITLSAAQVDAIENLGGGIYSWQGAAIVTDIDGRPVPDGTIVNLTVIDSIIARGFIDSTDSLSGSTLSDDIPFLSDQDVSDWNNGDAVAATSTTNFLTASVTRNGATRFIEQSDLILMLNNADSADKIRFVSSNPAENFALQLTQAYSKTYPNSVYPGVTDVDGDGLTEDSAEYVVGKALIGASILGVDADGNKTSGVATTLNGVASFRVEYPATPSTIFVGCGNPYDDGRYLPAGSADVVVGAKVGNNVAIVDSSTFCFSAIADLVITTDVSTISGTSAVIVSITDADLLELPLLTPSVNVNVTTDTAPALSVTATSCTTGLTGSCVATITVNSGAVSGDTAAIVFSVGGQSATVTLIIP